MACSSGSSQIPLRRKKDNTVQESAANEHPWPIPVWINKQPDSWHTMTQQMAFL